MDDGFKSKTQAKKDDHALQQLGEELTGLSPDQIEKIDMPIEVREAVRSARQTTAHGARNRQIKYLGGLLREMDMGPIYDAVENIRRGDRKKALSFKKLEKWRDSLIIGNPAVVEEILSACPQAERQRLMQLVRNAKREAEAQKSVSASRILFRYLNEISER